MIDGAMADRVVAVACALFLVGAAGVLWRRDWIVGLLSLQLMLAAGQLALVAFGARQAAIQGVAPAVAAQAFALVAVAGGAVQAVVGLAIGVAARRHRDSVDVEDASAMRW